MRVRSSSVFLQRLRKRKLESLQRIEIARSCNPKTKLKKETRDKTTTSTMEQFRRQRQSQLDSVLASTEQNPGACKSLDAKRENDAGLGLKELIRLKMASSLDLHLKTT